MDNLAAIFGAIGGRLKGDFEFIQARRIVARPSAKVVQVELATLQNWEQGRREPTGAAKALLRAIRNNPTAVLKALAAA